MTFSLNDGDLYVLFSLLGGTQQEFFLAGIDGVKLTTSRSGRSVGHEGGFDKVEQAFRHRKDERASVRRGRVGVRSRVDLGFGKLKK